MIVDIDLHYGDATANIFKTIPQVSYFHMPDGGGPKQIQLLSSHLNNMIDCDVVAVSAGFDRHVDDWGVTLTRRDYGKIGRIKGVRREKVWWTQIQSPGRRPQPHGSGKERQSLLRRNGITTCTIPHSS